MLLLEKKKKVILGASHATVPARRTLLTRAAFTHRQRAHRIPRFRLPSRRPLPGGSTPVEYQAGRGGCASRFFTFFTEKKQAILIRGAVVFVSTSRALAPHVPHLRDVSFPLTCSNVFGHILYSTPLANKWARQGSRVRSLWRVRYTYTIILDDNFQHEACSA